MNPEFSQDYAAEQLRRSRNPFRRLIKGFYLRNILKEVIGPTIDFACGAGQLLARLPKGSVGVEVNPFLIEELAGMSLNVNRYDTDIDHFTLAEFPENTYSTFIMSHFLEHFTEAGQIVKTLFHSCRRLGIRRIILALPGWKGYQSDSTHKTFVDSRYLQEHGLSCCEGYQIVKQRYFPINYELIGRYFVFHEFIVVLHRVE
jgi:SAM-dependent methyltransferase